MQITKSVVCVVVFSAIAASSLAQQPKPNDRIEFDPLAASIKTHLVLAYVNTRTCVHRWLEAQLYRGERSRQTLVESATTNCERMLQQAIIMLDAKPHTTEQIKAIVFKMAGEELSSIISQGR